jgi:hypothetical protein
MTRVEYIELLQKKKLLLGQIADNTERQIRFIRNRKMAGLKRLLRERQKLLDEWGQLTTREEVGREWRDHPVVNELYQQIQKDEQIVLAANALALQVAVKEKNQIAEEMCGNTKVKNIRQVYIGRWYQGLSRGFSRKV